MMSFRPPGRGWPILVLRCDGNDLFYYRSGSATPETLPLDKAAERLLPGLILIGKQGAADQDVEPDAALADKPRAGRRFGFAWFLPELKKHRKLWRDIILASLVIQLVGLATPLFTQVIIDKVVVHQTHGTLIVVGLALALFMLFTAIMSWLRQYLILHTGNRIDAVLGAEVFRQAKSSQHARLRKFTTSSSSFPKAIKSGSASVAPASPAANASASPSREPCSNARRC